MTEDEIANLPNDIGEYIMIGGKRRELARHPTDFSVDEKCSAVRDSHAGLPEGGAQQLAIGMTRVSAADVAQTEELMKTIRSLTNTKGSDKNVAHHVYAFKETGEEIIITDNLILTLQEDDPQRVDALMKEFDLVQVDHVGAVYQLRVTPATGINPLKTANVIAKREGVVSCLPKLLLPVRFGCAPGVDVADANAIAAGHTLFPQQWYLTTAFMEDKNLDPLASIDAPEAWALARSFGNSDIVIAVIDDGFDIHVDHPLNTGHDVFRDKKIDPHKHDFVQDDDSPEAKGKDFHGTCVASIATAFSSVMLGAAPCCSLLPIRMGLMPAIDPDMLLSAFKIASEFSDVVNCSFEMKPRTELLLNSMFMAKIKPIIEKGGRRKKGLVIVFAAGNDDAPTYLPADENRNGLEFVIGNGPSETRSSLPDKTDLHTGYPEIPGVVVVGAVTSLKRRAAYSNWGKKLTVVAPSSNGHGLTSFLRQGEDLTKAFPGLGMIAAVNRLTHGATPATTLTNDPGADIGDGLHTRKFGGTSAAAPLVTGVVAMMLSVNPDLTAAQVIEILKSTADLDLDMELDLPGDPNLQDVRREFIDGHSNFFGAGKVNAAKAVKLALEMHDQNA